MSLRGRRAETTPDEHEAAVTAAETRLGRELAAGEKRIDIVAIDRDLRNGKAELHAAILAEQRRAVEEWVATGMPIRLRVTDRMKTAVADLYDAGAEHGQAELKAAGITVA